LVEATKKVSYSISIARLQTCWLLLFVISYWYAVQKVRELGNAKRGSERSESLGDSYYLRLSNIRDATELYAGIKKDNLGLIVEYVSPVTFGKVSLASFLDLSQSNFIIAL
jgi:hypothetical protein